MQAKQLVDCFYSANTYFHKVQLELAFTIIRLGPCAGAR